MLRSFLLLLRCVCVCVCVGCGVCVRVSFFYGNPLTVNMHFLLLFIYRFTHCRCKCDLYSMSVWFILTCCPCRIYACCLYRIYRIYTHFSHRQLCRIYTHLHTSVSDLHALAHFCVGFTRTFTQATVSDLHALAHLLSVSGPQHAVCVCVVFTQTQNCTHTRIYTHFHTGQTCAVSHIYATQNLS